MPTEYTGMDTTKATAKKADKSLIENHQGKKYLRLIHSAMPGNTRKPISIDVYSVIEAYRITCPARQHALKKLLAAGERDKGSQLEDLQGVIDSMHRAVELQKQREIDGKVR